MQALSNFKQNIITLMHCDFILKWILVISELHYKNETDGNKKKKQRKTIFVSSNEANKG